MIDKEDTYIGDGIYVAFDGYNLILKTERGGRVEMIYLEPDIWRSLVEMAQAVKFKGLEGVE